MTSVVRVLLCLMVASVAPSCGSKPGANDPKKTARKAGGYEFPDVVPGFFNENMKGSSGPNVFINVTDMIESNTKAIDLDPKNMAAHSLRGTAYYAMGEYAKAITDFDEEIKLHPDGLEAYCRRAIAHGRNGDEEKTITDTTTVIGRDPNHGLANYIRGFGYRSAGGYGKTITDWKRAIELKPELPVCYAQLAWLLATCPDPSIRDGSKALENAEKAKEIYDSHPKVGPIEERLLAPDVLAAACAEKGDFERAITCEGEYLDSLLAADGNNVSRNYDEKRYQAAMKRLALYKAKKPYHVEG